MANDFSESHLPGAESDLNLAQRVARLEQRFDDALLMLSDLQRYSRLSDLLTTQQWREADTETTKVMLEVVGQSSQDDLSPEAVKSFPCNAIRVIDQLWKKHSSDRFGFSIQLQIYQDVGGSMDSLRAGDLAMLRNFGERIGIYQNKQWIDYEERDFSLAAPIGSLPADWWSSPYGAKMVNFFFMRLIACEL